MDEGNLLKGLYEIDEAVLNMEKKEGSYYKWSLFTVENALYIE